MTVAAIVFGLAVLSLTYGPFVLHGGFISDDWAIQDSLRGGYGSAVEDIRSVLGTRPVMWLLQPLPYLVLGTIGPTPHVVLAVAISVATSVAVYRFLLAIGLPRVHAAIVSLLFLLFPWSSSTRLWPIAALAQLSILLILVGATIAISGLRLTGATAVRRHVCAVICYVAAALVYETAAPVVLLSGLLYASLSSWRAARWRWAADVGVMAVGFTWVALNWTRSSPTLEEQLNHLIPFVRGGLVLLTRAAFPVDLPGRLPGVILAAGAAVAVLALLELRRMGVADVDRPALRQWLARALGAAIALPFVWLLSAASATFEPLSRGIDDRGNIGAALPIALLVWSLVMVAVLLLRRALRSRSRGAEAVLVAVVGVALVIGYAVRERQDVDDWVAAARESRRVLAPVSALPPLPRGTTIFTFGGAAESAPRLPVFFRDWEMNSAVQLVRNDSSVRAFPVYIGGRLTCGAAGVSAVLPVPDGHLPPVRSPYGRTVLVDVNSRRHVLIRDRAGCLAAAQGFAPGPLTLPD